MTREEEIVKAAKEFENRSWFSDIVHSKVSRGVDSACGIGFLEGAVWADEHPKEGFWNKDKVIEWLEDNLYDYIYINRFAGNVADWNTDLIKNLIKTMEE